MAGPFQPKFVDLVCNYTSTTGTSDFALGPTVNGLSSFRSTLQTGDSFYYSAIGIDKPAEREVGRGTLQANGTIARDPISGTKTNFSSGTKILSLVAAAEWFTTVQAGASGVADGNKGDITVSGSGASWALNSAGLAKISVTPQQYGAKGDGVTDDSAAFVAAIAYLKSIAVNNDGNLYKGSRKLFIPAGLYNLGTTTLDITHTLILEGESSVNGYGSRLKWTGDCDGIRIQACNTSGTSTVDGPHFGASYSVVRNLGLVGPYANNPDFTGKTEGEFHAIRAKTNYLIEDVFIDGFAGDGLYANTTVGGGGSQEGNSNCSFVNRLRVTNVRCGVFIDGADANAGTFIGVVGTYCRKHTVWDSSFLGNTHIGHHSAGTGLIKGVPACIVSYSGKRYAVAQGQAGAASTNAPSGTIADNTYWLYVGTGSADATVNIPAWTSGVAVREGGSYRTDNANAANVFIGCYSEGGEAPAQFMAPTHVMGGLWGTRDPVTTGNYFSGSKIVAPSPGGGATFGQTRIQANDNARQLGLWMNATTQAGIYSTLTFEQGMEADGVTPMAVGRIRAAPNTSSAATSEGSIWFGTRTYGGAGTYTDWLTINGPNLYFGPVNNNQMDSGSSGARWKTSYVYTLNAATAVTSAGSITSTGGGVGYAAGAGGAVTQATSKSTGVTLNKACGQITMNNAALAANTTVTFTVTNSQVAATDAIIANVNSGNAAAGSYQVWAEGAAAGSFKVNIRNISPGSLSEAVVVNFAVVKAVSA